MFGYCKPYIPSLTVAEHSFYKSIYCGLCHALTNTNCVLSGLSLSYDFVFLAMMRQVFSDSSFSLTPRRCVAHPLRREYAADLCDALSYSAAAQAVLVYYNVLDDIADGKASAHLLLPPAKLMLRRGKNAVPHEEIVKYLSDLRTLESEHCPSADRASDTFGLLLGELFRFGLPEEKRELAQRVGYLTGKWIYLADAVDDYDEDLKNGTYNPFLCGAEQDGKDPSEHREALRQAGVRSMHLVCRDLWETMDKVPFGDHGMSRSIADNIVSVAMPRTAERILRGLPGEKPRQKGEVLLWKNGDIGSITVK